MFGERISPLFEVFRKPNSISTPESKFDENHTMELLATVKDVSENHNFKSLLGGKITNILYYIFKKDSSKGNKKHSSSTPKDQVPSDEKSVKEHQAKQIINASLKERMSNEDLELDFISVEIPEDALQDLSPTDLFPTLTTKEMLMLRFVGVGGSSLSPLKSNALVEDGDDHRVYILKKTFTKKFHQRYREVQQAVLLLHAVWKKGMFLQDMDRCARDHSYEFQPVIFKRTSGDEMRKQLLKRRYHEEVTKAYDEVHQYLPLYNETVFQISRRRPY